MIQYKINIRETCSNESFTYWTNCLDLKTFKAIKRELLDQVDRYGTEHELTLTRLTDKKDCHWLGAKDETVITKIKTGLGKWERFLQRALNIED